MLLSQLTEVNEIDNRISQIHGELSQLYLQRSTLLQNVPQMPVTAGQQPAPQAAMAPVLGSEANEWAEAQYEALVAVWRQYGVALPSHRTMKTRLLKAHKTLQDIAQAKPEWQNGMTAVFVPASSALSFPVDGTMRAKQPFITSPDYTETNLPAVTVDKQWRLLLVYKEAEGLYAGSLEMMLDKKEQKVAGHDVTALGLREYLAFSLQQTKPVDVQTWTILPKDRIGNDQVPCVSYTQGQFRFVTDEVNSVFGDNRFRPAIEIKG